MYTKEQMEIIEARQRGEEIQSRIKGDNYLWSQMLPIEHFNFFLFEYRISPKQQRKECEK